MFEKVDRHSSYYGRKSKKGGYDWIVCIEDSGCFITDPIDDWDKDNDYADEAQSNPTLYEKLDIEKVATILKTWGRSLR